MEGIKIIELLTEESAELDIHKALFEYKKLYPQPNMAVGGGYSTTGDGVHKHYRTAQVWQGSFRNQDNLYESGFNSWRKSTESEHTCTSYEGI